MISCKVPEGTELSFFGFAKGERVINFIKSKVKHDILRGYETLFRGKMKLDSERVQNFRQMRTNFYHQMKPSELSPCEVYLAVQTGLVVNPGQLDEAGRQERISSSMIGACKSVVE